MARWTDQARSAVESGLQGKVRIGQTVLWTPGGSRVGNHLYFWLRASLRQSQGADYVIRRLPDMEQWLDLWPDLRSLTASSQSALNWLPPREDVPADYFQDFGGSFSRQNLDDFIKARLLSSDAFTSILREVETASPPGTLVINVRRTNYYSYPEHRGNYSFDIPAYLGTALAASRRVDGNIHAIDVVSDDMEWCRARLSWLNEHAEVVRFEDSTSPVHDFARIASGRRLIIPNSTFSYWAAYVSSVLHPGQEASICAPRFHSRSTNDRTAWQLDPRWTIIDQIPGGWDS